MRNQYPGSCYRCNKRVEAGAGHFERFGNSWRLQHADCAIEHRGRPDIERQKLNARNQAAMMVGTGKGAQKARARFRKEIEGMEF